MSERMDIVVDVSLGDVNIDNLRKAINKEVAGTAMSNASGAGAPSKTSGFNPTGDVAMAIKAVIGEALDELVSILQSLIKVIPPILGIFLVIKVIADVLGAFTRSFQNIGKIWDLIMTLIAKIYEPFANLLLPPLLPLLYLFTTIGRVMNLMLMPVFMALMKAFSQTQGGMQSAAMKFMTGDTMGGIQDILAAFGTAILSVKDQVMETLTPLFSRMADWIRGFLTLDLGAIHNTINELLGNQLGGYVNGFIDVLYKGISAIAGFVSQLVGKDTFDKVFGKGEFDKISKMNEGFKTGADIASVLQDAWKLLNDFINALKKDSPSVLWGKVAPTVETLALAAELLGITFLMFKPFIDLALMKMLKEVNKYLDSAKAVRVALFGEDGNGGHWKKISDLLSFDLADAIKKLAANISDAASNIIGWVRSAIDSLVSNAQSSTIEGGGGLLNDFIMRPGNGAVAFSPQDTIIGVKDPSMLGGGGGNVVNNYITVNDTDLERRLEAIVERVSSKTSRAGFYQKGW